MSLPQFDRQGSSLENVGSIVPALFDGQNKYQLFAQKVWPVLVGCREPLAECYTPDNGRPAVEPVVLLGVLILQFLERVPDRQAVEMVKYHLGWKLALHLSLSDPGFHPTTLVYFRQRLLEHAKGDLAFGAVLEALQQAGLLPKRCRQRLDSTHVVAAVANLSGLECVRETLRLALEELAEALPEAARPACWPLLWERYVDSKLDYRSSAEALQDKFRQAGADGFGLLQWLEYLRSDLRYGTQVELLAEVLGQRFALKDSCPEPLEQSEGSAVQSPHDPDAQYAAKGRGKQHKAWLGYKAQVAESLPEQNQPSFVVSIVTQQATQGDEPGLDQTLEAQAQSGLQRPSELYADGGYISGPRLHRAAQEGWSLMGPAKASPRRPGVDRLPVEAFQVDIAHRQACCPAGHQSGHCSRLGVRQKAGGVKVFYRFEWPQRRCQSCPLRETCIPPGQKHRSIIVGEHHEFLQQRRQEQGSAAFQQRMHQRNAIEGTLSELARGHGMRRSRYRGFGKVELQNLLIGTACNVKRWLRFLIREAMHAQTQAFRLKFTVQSLREGVLCMLAQSFWQSVSCWRALPLISVST
jgi:transposase